ncbi:MAG TPA: DNA internalization-related competence protein ComEC/Rec2, partial [Sedimenticola sp.]|nr:DNA internalization-related competence protein ComEC/Rec2 [Sedimenticola sp.]
AVALLEALVIGDRSALPPEAWARFRRTGTSHLIAISGLHVAIVAGLAALIGGWLWRRCEPCMLRLPAPLAGAFAALTAGFLYAALAGFSIPTQRALLMLTVALGAVFARREPQPARVLAAALTVVLVADSTAILSPGFWLSFAAVGVIAMSLWGRVGRPGALGGWAGVQWAVSIGLLPLLLLWQGEVPLLAPLVNLLLVPLFSLLLIPLALAGAITGLVFSPLGVPLLHLAGIGLERVQWLLAQVPDLPLRPLSPVTQLPPALWLSATAGVLLLLAPRGLPGRKAGILLLLPLLLQVPVRPAPGSIWLYLLDVGQGQSAVLRTRNHTLIYDAGPRFSAHFDAGSAVLVPFLKAQGVTRAERVILSNGDLDHMGGFHSLQQSLPVGVVMSGEPARVGISGVIPCRAGMAWQWDGVHFRILHPPSGADWRGNDASCVLQVEAGGVQLLLTGDIEAPAERALMASAPERLHSRLLLVPHHGSGSSSTSAFVAATAPEYALISAGYRNRYHFPKPSVVARWRRQGARVLNTASSGALLFRITPHAGILPPERYRCRSGRYWNDRPALCGE